MLSYSLPWWKWHLTVDKHKNLKLHNANTEMFELFFFSSFSIFLTVCVKPWANGPDSWQISNCFRHCNLHLDWDWLFVCSCLKYPFECQSFWHIFLFSVLIFIFIFILSIYTQLFFSIIIKMSHIVWTEHFELLGVMFILSSYHFIYFKASLING